VHRARIVVDCTKGIVGTGTGSARESTASDPKIPGTLSTQASTEGGKDIPGINLCTRSKSESEQYSIICPNWGKDFMSGRKQYLPYAPCYS
jgi:hypothetical protein